MKDYIMNCSHSINAGSSLNHVSVGTLVSHCSFVSNGEVIGILLPNDLRLKKLPNFSGSFKENSKSFILYGDYSYQNLKHGKTFALHKCTWDDLVGKLVTLYLSTSYCTKGINVFSTLKDIVHSLLSAGRNLMIAPVKDLKELHENTTIQEELRIQRFIKMLRKIELRDIVSVFLNICYIGDFGFENFVGFRLFYSFVLKNDKLGIIVATSRMGGCDFHIENRSLGVRKDSG